MKSETETENKRKTNRRRLHAAEARTRACENRAYQNGKTKC